MVETFPGWVFPDFRLKAILGILLVHSLISIKSTTDEYTYQTCCSGTLLNTCSIS